MLIYINTHIGRSTGVEVLSVTNVTDSLSQSRRRPRAQYPGR